MRSSGPQCVEMTTPTSSFTHQMQEGSQSNSSQSSSSHSSSSQRAATQRRDPPSTLVSFPLPGCLWRLSSWCHLLSLPPLLLLPTQRQRQGPVPVLSLTQRTFDEILSNLVLPEQVLPPQVGTERQQTLCLPLYLPASPTPAQPVPACNNSF